MKALIYHGPGRKSLDEHPKPVVTDPATRSCA